MADFSLARHTHWTLFSFAAVLAIPVTLYLLSSFVLPQAEHAGATDLRDWYFDRRIPFFAALMLVALLSFLKAFATDGHVAGGRNFWVKRRSSCCKFHRYRLRGKSCIRR